MKPALKKIKERVESKIDALLIVSSGDAPDPNMRYYAEMDEIVSGVFYWNLKGTPFVVVSDSKHSAGVRKIKRKTRDTPYELICKAGGKRIGYNANYISINRLKSLKKKLKGVKFIDVSEELTLVRSIKMPSELKEMKKASSLTKRAFKIAEESVLAERKELELFADLTSFYYKKGAQLAFDPIVASGKNTLYIHTNATNKKMKSSDTVIVDMGAKWNGYCSDFTETYCVNPNKARYELLETVGMANAYARDLVCPGMTAGDLCLAVKDFFGKQAEYWPYGLGHGVGVEIHEYPSLSLNSNHVLEKGMVFTIEPGLAVPGVGGARLEHTGVLTSKGFKIL
ncbi:M24 family metallopeptidase [archaeon]|nr:M24 family metallopeptidase [archaeon]